MKKAFLIIGTAVVLIGLIFGFRIWSNLQKHKKAQAIADSVIENLGSEDVIKEFPEKYFPKEQFEPVIGGIRQNCDWENRDGKFVDFFTQKSYGNTGISDQTAFIYEYYLSCDSLRFILTINMDSKPELMGFHVEPLEAENPMILFPEKQLKNR